MTQAQPAIRVTARCVNLIRIHVVSLVIMHITLYFPPPLPPWLSAPPHAQGLRARASVLAGRAREGRKMNVSWKVREQHSLKASTHVQIDSISSFPLSNHDPPPTPQSPLLQQLCPTGSSRGEATARHVCCRVDIRRRPLPVSPPHRAS